MHHKSIDIIRTLQLNFYILDQRCQRYNLQPGPELAGVGTTCRTSPRVGAVCHGSSVGNKRQGKAVWNKESLGWNHRPRCSQEANPQDPGNRKTGSNK